MSVKGVLEINDILNEYSNDIQEGITKEAIDISKEAKNKLKATSPKKTGDYRKGWRVKTTKGKGFVDCIVHNATDYQLTHLLEKPHLKRNARLGKTKPIVHIQPVDAACSAEYERKVEEVIRNA